MQGTAKKIRARGVPIPPRRYFDECKAGLDLAISRGCLWLHESGTYVKLTQAGADLLSVRLTARIASGVHRVDSASLAFPGGRAVPRRLPAARELSEPQGNSRSVEFDSSGVM